MVQIEEHQFDDDDDQHQPQPNQASSSNNTMNTYLPSIPPLSPSLSPLPRLTATTTQPPPPQQQIQHNAASLQSSPSSISSDHTYHNFSPTKSPHIPSPSPSPPHSLLPAPVVSTSRLIREQLPEVVTKTETGARTGFAGRGNELRAAAGTSEGREVPRKASSERNSVRREKSMKIAGFVLRVCEILVCLVSFSIMAADKNRGWALDSFDRYIEFRYSVSISVIGFAYSVLQGLDLLFQLTAGKDQVRSRLRYCFDFAIDQILAYLLLSSSSSAFTRVDDWISNWGKDKFPAMASASVGMSFLAFIAFALSSLISGYVLCTRKLTL